MLATALIWAVIIVAVFLVAKLYKKHGQRLCANCGKKAERGLYIVNWTSKNQLPMCRDCFSNKTIGVENMSHF